ncbi:hypothetical protein [Novosphingobium sp.]|uniref:hypothetical protein n=1 Tax=Novosphingobium sp. TaxID=1874826 RepID=UPI0035AE2711
MTTFRSNLLLLMLAVPIGGCDLVRSLAEDSRYCVAPKPLELLPNLPAKNAVEQMILAEDCVHRQSYRLAIAPGSNREIADAAVAACRDTIVGEAALRFKASYGRDANGREEQDLFAYLRPRYADQALFNVTSARAGKCKIP